MISLLLLSSSLLATCSGAPDPSYPPPDPSYETKTVLSPYTYKAMQRSAADIYINISVSRSSPRSRVAMLTRLSA